MLPGDKPPSAGKPTLGASGALVWGGAAFRVLIYRLKNVSRSRKYQAPRTSRKGMMKKRESLTDFWRSRFFLRFKIKSD